MLCVKTADVPVNPPVKVPPDFNKASDGLCDPPLPDPGKFAAYILPVAERSPVIETLSKKGILIANTLFTGYEYKATKNFYNFPPDRCVALSPNNLPQTARTSSLKESTEGSLIAPVRKPEQVT